MILITIFILILQISLSESQIFSYGRGKINSIYSCRIAALSTLFAGFLSLNALHLEKLEKGVSVYCGLFQVSYSNLLIETLIYIIGALVLLSSTYIMTYLLVPRAQDPGAREISDDLPVQWVRRDLKEPKTDAPYALYYLKSIKGSLPAKNYSLIALFSMLGSSLLLASCDLLSMYLSIELQSFSLYVLATLYRNSGSTSAGLKYFLLGGLSSCIILLGSGLVYALTGLTGFDSLYSLISSMNIINLESLPLGENLPILEKLRPDYNGIMSLYYENTSLQRFSPEIVLAKEMVTVSKDFQLGLSLGLILIFSGLLFKISAAPFHNWSPDVYDESPTYVTTWLTVMPKISILILLFEIYFHMALPTSLEEYSSNFTSLLLNSVSGVGGELADLPDNLIVSGNLSTNYLSSTIPTNLELATPTPAQGDRENNILIDYLERPTLLGNAFFLEDTTQNPIDLLTTLKLNTDVLLKNILLFSSLLSLIIGTVLGLSQIKIKRLLAYSTISHVGFLLLCLAIKTEVSVESFIFYLIQYSITNLNAFLILLALGALRPNLSDVKKETDITKENFGPLFHTLSPYEEEQLKPITKENLTDSSHFFKPLREGEESKSDVQFINELQEKFKHNPALSISFALTLFSMAGIPPLIGFFAKQSVIYSAIDSGYYFMTVIAIIVSVISASYYLRLVKEANSSLEDISIEKFIPYKKNVDNDAFHITEKSKTDDALVYFLSQTPVSRKLLGAITNDRTVIKEKADDLTPNEEDHLYVRENNNARTGQDITGFRRGAQSNLSSIHAFIISTLTCFILLFFLNPSTLMNSATLITVNYFYL